MEKWIAGIFLICCLIFPNAIFAQAPVEVWYGNLDGSPMQVQLGQEILVPVYIRTSPGINLVYESINLGTEDTYVVSRQNGETHPPISTWSSGGFPVFGDSPGQGQTSQERTSYSLTSPLHFETPTLILEFRVTVSSDPGLVGQTVPAMLAGYNPNAPVPGERTTFFVDDQIANIYYPDEHFSDFTFVEVPADIPALSEWGMILLGLILIGTSTVAAIRRRRRIIGNITAFIFLILILTLLPFKSYMAIENNPAIEPEFDPPLGCSQYSFVMGDYDGDSDVDVLDFLNTIGYLLNQPPDPYLFCWCCTQDPPGPDDIGFPVTLDVNADCMVNASDVIRMFQHSRSGIALYEPSCSPW